MPTLRSTLLALLILLVVPATSLAAGGLPGGGCSASAPDARPLEVPVAGTTARSLYALPVSAPSVLVVFAHGYSHRAEGWAPRLSRTAATEGVLAVVPNYRGLVDLPPDAGGVPRSRGYPVKAGGEDLIATTQALLAACPSVRDVVLMGVSMGGNASGLALAAKPKRPGGAPLFDYWIGVEGAFNLIELYEGSRAVAQVSEFAANAKADIETETGGTPETAPAAYQERTVIARAADVANAGLKGVYLVHGVEDGLAPYDNGVQMTNLLRRQGVPLDFVTVTRRGPTDDPDTTLSGYAGVETGLAGHGGELSENHAVIDAGFARLHALLATTEPRPCGRDFTFDKLAGTITPDPAATSSTCRAGTPLAAPAAAPGAAACRDRTRPTLRSVRARALRGRRIRISGRWTDRSCGKVTTSTARVRVAISRTLGRGRCQVVRRSGRLGTPQRCARRGTLSAGSRPGFTLRLPKALPRGSYAIRVTVRDAAGNARAVKRRVRVR